MTSGPRHRPDLAELPTLEQLLPHGKHVLLLHEVVEHDALHTVALVDVEHQRWLKRHDGSVAAWVALEYMAQCVAAHEGLNAYGEGATPRGLLIGVQQLRLLVQHYDPRARLWVGARRIRGRPGLGVLSHQCTIHTERRTNLLAEGRLSISVEAPGDPAPRAASQPSRTPSR